LINTGRKRGREGAREGGRKRKGWREGGREGGRDYRTLSDKGEETEHLPRTEVNVVDKDDLVKGGKMLLLPGERGREGGREGEREGGREARTVRRLVRR